MLMPSAVLACRIFRAALPHHDDLDRTAEMSRAEPGRFNTPEVGAVYAALDADTALQEMLRSSHQDGESRDCALFVVDVTLREVVWLTDPAERERWGITESAIQADDVSGCQAIVTGLIASGVEAIVWPSAVAGGRSVAVYIDHLSADSRLTIEECHAIGREALQSIRGGRPVTDVIPALALESPRQP